MPAQRRARLVNEYGLPHYDANLLTASKASADYFESCMAVKQLDPSFLETRAKTISNWIVVELGRLLNLKGMEISAAKVTPPHLVELVELIEVGTLSTTLAKAVLEEAFDTGESPAKIVQERGYVQISDSGVVDSAVAEAVTANPQAVADYLKGKETAAKFLVGQVMKITKGKANPALVNDLVKRKLETMKSP